MIIRSIPYLFLVLFLSACSYVESELIVINDSDYVLQDFHVNFFGEEISVGDIAPGTRIAIEVPSNGEGAARVRFIRNGELWENDVAYFSSGGIDVEFTVENNDQTWRYR